MVTTNDRSIQNILDEVWKQTDQYIQSNKGIDFNVFESLGIEDKEVLMCRMLAELLNSKGMHGQGTVFLEEFCKCVLTDLSNVDAFDTVELKDSNISTEYLIPGSDRRIDIVIQTPYRFIPIEVKIYAGDQKDQIKDYCAYTEKIMSKWQGISRSWRLFYLTLDGHQPSVYSSGVDSQCRNRISCISWKVQISEFLEKCLKLTIPIQVHEIIRQYKNSIDKIAGNATDWRMQIMTKILMSKKNIEIADLIADSIADVKTAMLGKLFDEVGKALDKRTYSHVKPQIDRDPDFDEHLKRFYQSPNNNDAIGLDLRLKEMEDDGKGTSYSLGIRFDITDVPAVGAVLLKYVNGEKVRVFNAKKEKPELFKQACRLMNIKEDESGENVYLHWHYVPGIGHDDRHNEAPNFSKNSRDEKYYGLYEADGLDRFVNAVADAVMDYYEHADWKALR
jgi:hypothetical protein